MENLQDRDLEEYYCCGICCELYDLVCLRPFSLDCGHSLCNECLKRLLCMNQEQRLCPFCKNRLFRRSFDQFSVNYEYQSLIRCYLERNLPSRLPNYKEVHCEKGIYKGQVKPNTNRTKNGKGVFLYNDGSEYNGEWFNDKRSGYGKFTYPNNSKYEGEWLNDLPHGKGKFDFANGEIKTYDGNWSKGKFFGFGRVEYLNGTSLETIFFNGISCCDILKYEYSDHTILARFDSNGNRIGKSYQVDTRGNILVGEFQGEDISKRDCEECTLYKSNGDKYEGPISKGLENGVGKLSTDSGDTYLGCFLNGVKHGKGEERLNSGEQYTGEFKNNKRDGMGELILPNGDVYHGEFKNGKKEGHGKFVTHTTYVYEGEFKNDLKEGQGVEVFPDHETYCGEFKRDKREGKGIYIFKSTETYKGDWKNNTMNGHGTFITTNGDELTGNWVDGKLTDDKLNKKCMIY